MHEGLPIPYTHAMLIKPARAKTCNHTPLVGVRGHPAGPAWSYTRFVQDNDAALGKTVELISNSLHMPAERNLLCTAWPEEFGGGGASVWEQTVVREEMWAHHEPRGAQYMGVNWVGPIIMRHGTEEQQRKHLPPIARGEVIWC